MNIEEAERRISALDDKWRAELLVLIAELEKVEVVDDLTYVSPREMNCAGCRRPGRCEVTFKYTEGGKVESADVTRMADGWEYRPYGNAGGEAPYCPKCLEGDSSGS